MPSYIVTVSGEIPLRSSRTRPRFYRRLIENIRDAVSREGGKVIEAEIVESKIYLRTDKEVAPAISRVFGVHRVGTVLTYEFRDLSDLAKWAAENSRDLVAGKTFAVRVKRSGNHPFTSLDVAREVGTLLKPYSRGVDLESPEVKVELEVRGERVFLYRNLVEGPGGLPIGVEGRGIVLFSGGFDSPIAAWLIAKRGVQVDFLHFILGSSWASYLAFKVASKLSSEWLYGYRPRFIVVDFRRIVEEIVKKIEWSMRQVVLRALMYKTAMMVAELKGYDAIITGESIGQASSQTLKNIEAIEAVLKPTKPILRPLVGFDKEEIIALSRKIGLYELSAKVPEACAIAPSRVETKASPEELSRELDKLDPELVNQTVNSLIDLDLLESRPEDVIPGSDLEIEFLPENALVVDARNWRGIEDNALPGSIPLSKFNPEEIPKDKTIVVVCENGSISLIVAGLLREKGLKAYSLKNGLVGLKSSDSLSALKGEAFGCNSNRGE
ncbi:tRNA uracil 4-sulfurtransferase ThiI [Thermogladius sp. 4427co]|uniref:tRNA uracil 4-sulfurtransferase ThiI n=1 Tax=Thermogladius sp. 4427co TaxID=3450718 RepID=UPI003F78E487